MKSLRILISHPYLVLLPTFTFFSFSKLRCCGDRRVSLSPGLTIVNMVINTAPGCIVCGFFILALLFLGIIFVPEERSYSDVLSNPYYILLLFLFLSQPFFSVIFTLLFLYLEKISCFSCCQSAGRLVRVFDPEQPEKTFIMEDGQVVEADLDVEEGEHSELKGLEEKCNSEPASPTPSNITSSSLPAPSVSLVTSNRTRSRSTRLTFDADLLGADIVSLMEYSNTPTASMEDIEFANNVMNALEGMDFPVCKEAKKTTGDDVS